MKGSFCCAATLMLLEMFPQDFPEHTNNIPDQIPAWHRVLDW
jgi:hypothetical protein